MKGAWNLSNTTACETGFLRGAVIKYVELVLQTLKQLGTGQSFLNSPSLFQNFRRGEENFFNVYMYVHCLLLKSYFSSKLFKTFFKKNNDACLGTSLFGMRLTDFSESCKINYGELM